MTTARLVKRTDMFDLEPRREGLIQVKHLRVTRKRDPRRCAECGALASNIYSAVDRYGHRANVYNICRRQIAAK